MMCSLVAGSSVSIASPSSKPPEPPQAPAQAINAQSTSAREVLIIMSASYPAACA
jgi:hypothetical protein